MTFWLLLGAMCVLATLFVALPLYARQNRPSVLGFACIALIVALSAGLYAKQGSPGLPSVANGQDGALPDVSQMVDALAERLERNPDDAEGWKMLGRSQMALQNFAGAVDAFERANAMESSRDAPTLVGLGEALIARDNARVEGRIANLFESALSIDPNNGTALFYGGIGALNRGDRALAADRWETLLSLSPPEEIRQILTSRIAEWRGTTPSDQPGPTGPAGMQDFIVKATIAVAPEAANALPPQATVFVIARDPDQPLPPIAVVRRVLSDLPATVTLGDDDSMMPGRSLSLFDEFELLARVSVSGQVVRQTGDWFGTVIVRPSEAETVQLTINQQVP